MRPARPLTGRLLTLLGGLLFVLAIAAIAYFLPAGGRSPTRAASRVAPPATAPRRHVPVATPRRFQLVARRLGRLAQPIQDAAAAAFAPGPAVLLGGLTPTDVSSDTISIVANGGSRVIRSEERRVG